LEKRKTTLSELSQTLPNHELDPRDMMRLWKALFKALWWTDKWENQAE
ncbi:nucleolar, Nop52, partial [Kipferlia bialata]